MLVREVMSTPVLTVAGDETLDEAVERMLVERAGSVVVTAQGESPAETVPAGILTDTDVLAATCCSDEPLSTLSVREAASAPLVTIAPDRTVGRAIDTMTEERIKHLPVVDDLDIVGIVTLTDVAVRYDEIRAEAIALAERAEEWD